MILFVVADVISLVIQASPSRDMMYDARADTLSVGRRRRSCCRPVAKLPRHHHIHQHQ
jgi:hypothetical protein